MHLNDIFSAWYVFGKYLKIGYYLRALTRPSIQHGKRNKRVLEKDELGCLEQIFALRKGK